MAKAHERRTCTECSARRQQCDRRLPCGRCVRRGIPEKCQSNRPAARHAPSRPRAHPTRPRPLKPTPREDTPARSPDPGLLPAFTTNDLPPDVADQAAAWTLSRPNVPRQRYVFTPYELAQLRRRPADVASRSTLSFFFSSLGTATGLAAAAASASEVHPAAAAYETFLQMLLPSVDHIWKLVDFHETYLLWYHCGYHGPTFRSELERVIAEQDDQATLDIRGLRLQWLALLFAIMAGSLKCTSERRLREWGFSKGEAV